MNNSPLRPAPEPLVASYRLLLKEAIETGSKPSTIHLARHHDDEATVPLHRSTVMVAGLMAESLDDDSAAAFLLALRDTYQIPEFTTAQGVVLLEFASHLQDVFAIELHGWPATVYPNGALWVLIHGYPTLWLASQGWRLHVGDTTTHDASSLESAVQLSERLRNRQTEGKA